MIGFGLNLLGELLRIVKDQGVGSSGYPGQEDPSELEPMPMYKQARETTGRRSESSHSNSSATRCTRAYLYGRVDKSKNGFNGDSLDLTQVRW